MAVDVRVKLSNKYTAFIAIVLAIVTIVSSGVLFSVSPLETRIANSTKLNYTVGETYTPTFSIYNGEGYLLPGIKVLLYINDIQVEEYIYEDIVPAGQSIYVALSPYVIEGETSVKAELYTGTQFLDSTLFDLIIAAQVTGCSRCGG